MTPIDYFAWFVFLIIVLSAAYLFIALGQLPGRTARSRNHPQADAIEAASWLGLLLTLGVVWVIAMVWARMTPVAAARSEGGGAERDLEARVAALEAAANVRGGADQ